MDFRGRYAAVKWHAKRKKGKKGRKQKVAERLALKKRKVGAYIDIGQWIYWRKDTKHSVNYGLS